MPLAACVGSGTANSQSPTVVAKPTTQDGTEFTTGKAREIRVTTWFCYYCSRKI